MKDRPPYPNQWFISMSTYKNFPSKINKDCWSKPQAYIHIGKRIGNKIETCWMNNGRSDTFISAKLYFEISQTEIEGTTLYYDVKDTMEHPLFCRDIYNKQWLPIDKTKERDASNCNLCYNTNRQWIPIDNFHLPKKLPNIGENIK